MDPIASLLSAFACGKLHVGVIGLGAVGGVYGAALLEGVGKDARIRVSFLVTPRHMQPLQDDGLRVLSAEGERVYRPDGVASSPRQLDEPVHIAVLAVKGCGLEAALRYWSSALAGNAWVLSLLNGLNNGAIMTRLLPGRRILDGCVYVGAHLVAPGRVCWEGGPRRLLCGDFNGDGHKLDCLCELFRRGGVAAESVNPVAWAVWEKFFFVSPVAVVTSIHSCSLRGILEDESRLNLFRDLVRELLVLAETLGRRPPGVSTEDVVEKLRPFDERTTSSLLRDLSQGRRGEFDVLVQEVVELSVSNGLDLPVYHRCWEELLKCYQLA